MLTYFYFHYIFPLRRTSKQGYKMDKFKKKRTRERDKHCPREEERRVFFSFYFLHMTYQEGAMFRVRVRWWAGDRRDVGRDGGDCMYNMVGVMVMGW